GLHGRSGGVGKRRAEDGGRSLPPVEGDELLGCRPHDGSSDSGPARDRITPLRIRLRSGLRGLPAAAAPRPLSLLLFFASKPQAPYMQTTVCCLGMMAV